MESEVVMSGLSFAAMGAAFSAMLAGAGSSLGVSAAGAKGGGVLAEKPHLGTKIIVLSALPGSQAIYGLVVALLLLVKAGLVGGAEVTLTVEEGHILFASGLVMGVAGLFSGWFQGKVSASGVGALARDESALTKAIILSALVETNALLGLIVAIMTMISVGA